MRSWFLGVALLLPAFILALSGISYLQDGQSEEAAFPVPYYLSLNFPVLRAEYADAAGALRHSDVHDGNSQLSLAEARYHSGIKPQYLLSEIEGGLAHAPASAEGWAFYAEALERVDPIRASRALGQAFTLAPYDFFWAGQRARLAARLWDYLDSDTKVAAIRQAQMLWSEPMLHDNVLSLSLTSDGEKFLTRAYAGEPDVIRAINRFVSNRRRQLQSEKP